MANNFTFLNESSIRDDDDNDENDSSFDRSTNNLLEDDYYTFLNLPRNAKPEDIQMQYRRLSKIYHPDKHLDPEFKINAERLFNKLRHVHEVLMDPEKRAIYDTLGAEALQEAQQHNSQCMDLVTRYRTPTEIREDFERLQREREEQRMERQANPKGSITVNINASEIFTIYDHLEDEEDYYYDTGPYIELTGFHFAQSIEAPITLRDTIIMSGSVSAENGRGRGNIAAGVRRTFGNRTSAEFEVGGNTNGMDFGFKGFSLIGSKYHTNCSIACQSTSEGLKPAMVASFGRHFDDKSNGQIVWRAGGMGGLQTQYIWDDSITRFVASVHLGVPHSYVSCHVSRKLDEKKVRVRALIRGGTFGFYTECGIEKKVSQLTTLSAAMVVGVPVGVNLRIKILRSNQTYNFPIHLCDQILPAPIVYGTITPLILWVVVNKLFVEPYERERKSREKAKLKAQNRTRMMEKKTEADSAIQLMKLAFARIVADEEARRGLIITSAKYGRLISTLSTADIDSSGAGANDEIIDVTIPLQCLVKDSKLILHDNSKSNLPGFYDPVPWEEKRLMIQYLFRNKAHEVIVNDEESISIPKESHQINLVAT
ncbi:dnaJ homolog subfamily C member 11 [Folsomia candida]|uniref:DnaJ subfamily C member 11 n=1 Tax=Folsomia candida TaxID=158441 RepID=A0A226DYQ9_FOLCA|nr:dnaJ homolog subfamily C member 11 [Folsomia candida]OXA50582.1 DnaJ subfamily C member 11 [Folsomia candida]